MAQTFSLSNTGSFPALPKSYSGPSIATTSPTVSSNTSGLIAAGNQPSTLTTPKPVPGMLPTTPVKSIATPDGTTTTFHPPEADAASKTASSAPSTPTVSATTDQTTPGMYSATTGLTSNGLTPGQVSQGYSTVPGLYNPVTGQLKSSAPTYNSSVATPAANANGNPIAPPITRQSAAQGVLDSGQPSTQEQIDSQRASQLYNAAQLGKLEGNVNSGQYNVNDPNSRPDLYAPELAGNKAADTSLYDNLSGIGYGAAENALSNDLNINNQKIGTAENVFSGTAPILGQYGQNNYNTLGGNPTNGTIALTGQPANDLTTLTSSVANNSISYNDAYSQLSSAYGAAVANQLLPSIQKSNPNFNVNTSTGTAAGQSQVASTAGGITSNQLQQKATYQSALQQGQNLQSQLNDLISTFGLNPSDINVVNAGLQKIAANTSDPHYAALQNYVNDIANTYAQILTPPGGSSTDTTRGIATSMLNATASGQSITSVMQSLDQAAQAKIAGVVTPSNTGNSSNSSTQPTSFAESWF